MKALERELKLSIDLRNAGGETNLSAARTIEDQYIELRRLAEVNAELLGALEKMVKEFGYGVIHPQGMVHAEHEAIRSAMDTIAKAKEQQ